MEDESVPLKLSKGVSTMSLGDAKTKVCYHLKLCPSSFAAWVGYPYEISDVYNSKFGQVTGCSNTILTFKCGGAGDLMFSLANFDG
jgi:hypothetical protein